VGFKPHSTIILVLHYIFSSLGFLGPCILHVPTPLRGPREVPQSKLSFSRFVRFEKRAFSAGNNFSLAILSQALMPDVILYRSGHICCLTHHCPGTCRDGLLMSCMVVVFAVDPNTFYNTSSGVDDTAQECSYWGTVTAATSVSRFVTIRAALNSRLSKVSQQIVSV
jgi:hypothetical protein